MKTYIYRGYKLIRDASTGNYRVATPSGNLWEEVAANIATAKKWVNCDLAEKSNRKAD